MFVPARARRLSLISLISAVGIQAEARSDNGRGPLRELEASRNLTLAPANLGLATRLPAAQSVEDQAQQAAEAWLKQTDAGQHDAAWGQSAAFFKDAISKEKWRQAVTQARTPLGKLVSRKVKSRLYSERLPGAPEGKYVVIQYDAVFEKQASALETITPMLDADGVWRVSGYYVR